jgi:hypothetical protein
MKIFEIQVMENGKFEAVKTVGKNKQNVFYTRKEAEAAIEEHKKCYPFALRMRVTEIN